MEMERKPLMPMPSEIPEDLWRDLRSLRDRLSTFRRDAQAAAHDQEHRTGCSLDFDYYRWLEPIAQAIDAIAIIDQHGPHRTKIIPFPSNRGSKDLVGTEAPQG
jgi:hypothetical protein